MRQGQGSASPTARYFGGQVRHFRQNAGLSRDELADAVGYSKSMITAVEQGCRIPRPPMVEALDRVLDARGALVAGGQELADDKYLPFFAGYAAAEQGCLSMQSYEVQVIPGLLQTEGYARAVISARCPPLDDDEIDRRVQARLDRQVLITRRPPAVLGFVVEESALRRPLGGRAVLREQLHRLLECAAMRHVSIQVMSWDVQEHTGLDGPITLMETSDGRHVGYIEGQTGGDPVTDVEKVRMLTQRYGVIRAQALTTMHSVQLIKEMVGEL